MDRSWIRNYVKTTRLELKLRRMTIAFGLVFLAVWFLFAGILGWQVYQSYQQMNTVYAMSQEVHTLEKSLIDQETGQRGFDLTGNPVFLQPYLDGTTTYHSTSIQLQNVGNTDPSLNEAIQKMVNVGLAWHERYGAPQVQERLQGHSVSLAELIDGKSTFDEFRNEVSIVQKTLNVERAATTHAVAVKTEWVFSLMLVLSGLIGIGILLAIMSQFRKIIQRIQQVGEAVSAYANQQFEVPLPLSEEDDEVTDLIRNVEKMRMKLKAHDATMAEENRTLQALSALDGLTGVLNRRTFDTDFVMEWHLGLQVARPLSIIMLDIDYFKDYNDTYGHLVGDECLKKVVAGIRSAIHKPGDLLARYGGEEFIIMLPDTDTGGAVQVAERIRAAIEGLCVVHAKSKVSPVVTVSLGVVSGVPALDVAPTSLISKGDKALYQAKKNGRNRVEVFTDGENVPSCI